VDVPTVGRVADGKLHEGEQRDAQVSELLEKSVEARLVGDGTAEDGRAVVRSGDLQPVEPGGPTGPEVPLDSDLVLRDARLSGLRRGLVGGHSSTVRIDLVSAHHINW
jgi:hypothetical protein